MQSNRFDQISRLFAGRRMSRRAAVRHGVAGAAAAGLAATVPRVAVAQGATPEPVASPAPGGDQKVAYLFLQSFQAGSLTPKEGEEGRFSLTLESGLGQTIYFSDRPLRDVGATPTSDFLENLGFPADNPPNAALLVEDGDATNIAVVELFNPTYDQATRTATYDVVPLADFERTAGGGFGPAPADLSAVPSSFDTAHLFIDDCADQYVNCFDDLGYGKLIGTYGVKGFCWNYLRCVPCEPYYHANPYDGAAWDWWSQQCNHDFSECRGNCDALTSQPF